MKETLGFLIEFIYCSFVDVIADNEISHFLPIIIVVLVITIRLGCAEIVLRNLTFVLARTPRPKLLQIGQGLASFHSRDATPVDSPLEPTKLTNIGGGHRLLKGRAAARIA